MSEIHNTKKRMPVILNQNQEQDWLRGEQVDNFIKPVVELKAVEV